MTKDQLLQNLNSVEANSKGLASLSALFYSIDQTAFANYKSNLLFNNACAALTSGKREVLGSINASVIPSQSSLNPHKDCSEVQILSSGANIVIQYMLNFADGLMANITSSQNSADSVHKLIQSETFVQTSEASKHLIEAFAILGDMMITSYNQFTRKSLVTVGLILGTLLLVGFTASLYFFSNFLESATFEQHRAQHLLRYWGDSCLQQNKHALGILRRSKIIQTSELSV